MSKASSGFGKIFAWLLAVVFLVAIVGVAVFFALRSQGDTYFVEHDGERYFASHDNGALSLYTEETYHFAVRSLTGGEVDYSVKVMSSSDNIVCFACNGEFHYSYTENAETDDYSEIFGLQANSVGFSVTVPQGMTVEAALETKYGGDITLVNELSDAAAYFVIVVTADESSVSLPFTLGIKASGVTLDPPSIIF